MTTTKPLIIGLGKTGVSFAHYLASKSLPFIVLDSRENPPGIEEFRKSFPDIEIHLGTFDQSIIDNASEILMSPGIDPNQPLFKDKKIIGDIEIFAREAKAPIIAITGTNAKGTVTTLVGEMIKTAGLTPIVGGNIGIPALDLLNEPVPDFYVLEISSFQLETTHHLPAIAATILNMSPDHLDRHHTMQNYHSIKQRIYTNAKTAVINNDDTYSKPIVSVSNQITFGLKENQTDFHLMNDSLYFRNEKLLSINDLKIKGKHNWSNALAALALGHAIHLPLDAMINTLKEYKGLEHRCEWVLNHDTIQWINDSKGTNIGATIAALEGIGSTISGKIILIAGGVGKEADFSLLQKATQQYTSDVVLFGRDADKINLSIKNHTRTHFTNTLTDAIKLADALAKPNDAVLFSPACASFDMFRDFEERGRVFKRLVKEYFDK